MLPEALKRALARRYVAARYHTRLGRRVVVNHRTVMEGRVKVGDGVNLADSYVGTGTYIERDATLPNTKIGRYCSISSNVQTKIGMHPTERWVSTHPSFFSTQKQAGFTFVERSVFEEHRYVEPSSKFVAQIGSDVWIGINVVIFDGVAVGDGAIIGANAVVTKNIEPYSINVGVPARGIKYRFERKYIDFLLAVKWWDRGIEWIKKHHGLFQDVAAFYDAFKDMV
jgi:acetyltransferase-like isoleucine patch superfamily enzyme